ncbi:hypothetical protein SAY87_006324 [Trapa incisa]|uniref:Methyltransferase n=1 Tax=Trapa incisa TaxID=236973 RepID=A0AAN7PY33_9MYRT|nr:hypothetical protein SAY87_006324 [Trapa incisa]
MGHGQLRFKSLIMRKNPKETLFLRMSFLLNGKFATQVLGLTTFLAWMIGITLKGFQIHHIMSIGRGTALLNPPSVLFPFPKGCKKPVPWPKSRDKIWSNNVPHTKLADIKGRQNWLKVSGEYLNFPGGGTQFIHGASGYINLIEQVFVGIRALLLLHGANEAGLCYLSLRR